MIVCFHQNHIYHTDRPYNSMIEHWNLSSRDCLVSPYRRPVCDCPGWWPWFLDNGEAGFKQEPKLFQDFRFNTSELKNTLRVLRRNIVFGSKSSALIIIINDKKKQTTAILKYSIYILKQSAIFFIYSYYQYWNSEKNNLFFKSACFFPYKKAIFFPNNYPPRKQ